MNGTPANRPIYHADYTESMATETLMQIRSCLLGKHALDYPGSWESKRLRRINQVLRERGYKNLQK